MVTVSPEVILNKSEQKYLANFIKYGMDEWRGQYYWGQYETGNRPVSIGRTVESLIEKGLVEKVFCDYRKTSMAENYICRYRESNVKGCNRGYIYDMDENLGKCEKCSGLGVTQKPFNFNQPMRG